MEDLRGSLPSSSWRFQVLHSVEKYAAPSSRRDVRLEEAGQHGKDYAASHHTPELTGCIGPHCVHQQEVLEIILLPNPLHNAS